MIYLLLIVSLINVSNSDKFEIDKDIIRKLFYFSIESEDSLKIFEKKLKESQNRVDSNFLNAYYGAFLTLVAKHAINPYKKYYKLKEGLDLLKYSIQNEPEKLEYRFLRLSILNYVPSFLGFDDIFFDDYRKIKILIMKKDYTEINREIQRGIVEFLMRSEKISTQEKKLLIEIYKHFE